MEDKKVPKVITNLKDVVKVGDNPHDIKQTMKNIEAYFRGMKMPMFLASYSPNTGFIYNAILPQELDMQDEQVDKKFYGFLRVCTDFDKNAYMPQIQETQTSEA